MTEKWTLATKWKNGWLHWSTDRPTSSNPVALSNKWPAAVLLPVPVAVYLSISLSLSESDSEIKTRLGALSLHLPPPPFTLLTESYDCLSTE